MHHLGIKAYPSQERAVGTSARGSLQGSVSTGSHTSAGELVADSLSPSGHLVPSGGFDVCVDQVAVLCSQT